MGTVEAAYLGNLMAKDLENVAFGYQLGNIEGARKGALATEGVVTAHAGSVPSRVGEGELQGRADARRGGGYVVPQAAEGKLASVSPEVSNIGNVS